MDEFFLGAIIAGPRVVAERIRSVARDVEADEVMLSTLVPELEDRRASLERAIRAVRETAA